MNNAPLILYDRDISAYRVARHRWSWCVVRVVTRPCISLTHCSARGFASSPRRLAANLFCIIVLWCPVEKWKPSKTGREQDTVLIDGTLSTGQRRGRRHAAAAAWRRQRLRWRARQAGAQDRQVLGHDADQDSKNNTLHDPVREAAVALAEITRRPQESDDPIAKLDFGSPVCVAPSPCVWSSGRRVLKPLRPELEHRMCELPCVLVGMPMTAAQCSLALMCSMPLACALPCAPDA